MCLQAAEEEMRIKFELQKKERKTRIANTSVIQHSYSWNQTENQATNYDTTPPNVSAQHRSTSSMQLMPPPPPVLSPNTHLHALPEKSCVSVLQPAFTAVTTADGATSSKTAITGAKRSRDAAEDTTTDHNNGGSQNESSASEDDDVPVSKKRNSGGYFFGLFG